MAQPDQPPTAKRASFANSALPLAPKQALAQTKRTPQDPHGWKEHGRHLLNANDLEGAKAALRKAAELAPGDYGISLLLAHATLNGGDEHTALDHFEHVLTLNSHVFDAQLHLAFLWLRRNETAKSVHHVEIALAIQPDNVAAQRIKAQLLTLTSKHEDAAAILQRLIKQDPHNSSGYWNDLGNLKRDLAKFDEALECYRKASAHSSTSSIALSNQITLLHYMPDRDPSEILDLCKKWGRTFTPRKAVMRPRPVDTSCDRALKIGMVSDGFRQHPVGAMITPALAHLKDAGIDLYLYSSSSSVDRVTEKIMASATRWIPIFNKSDQELAARIRQDQIDVLIDLSGHNTGTRMKTIAMEPAPVIVKWVGGLINTTGVEAFDYLITDGVESPLGSDEFYTEKLIRMPDDYICYMPPEYAPEIRELPALRNGYVTFGCFNNPTKINDTLLGHWARLLHAVPESRLYLKSGPFGTEDLRQRTLNTLADHGISPDRIRMEGHSQHHDLLSCYNDVDIALDPWPYSGGLTTCEAMLMGVPVVSLPGPTFAGRHSATHLVNAGMPELVVSNWSEYQTCAVGLASDLQSLATIRSHLRHVLLESPVCNGARFARHLTAALRAIWQRFCDGKRPAALAFTSVGQPWFEDDERPTSLTQPRLKTCPAMQQDFQFALKNRILTLDHGASLAGSSALTRLSQLDAFTVITIDPAGTLKNSEELTHAGLVHQYTTHVALGDGNPATLYACLDTQYSGTLEPFPPEHQPSFSSQGVRVLTKMPIPTVALDSVEGLNKTEWLILDDRHDNQKILLSAPQALTKVLIMQVRVTFAALFKEQGNFGELCATLTANGFQLLRLNNFSHGSHFASSNLIKDAFEGSQLVSADAIFVPDASRLTQIEKESRIKLAFLLHTVYQAPDMAHRVLALSEDDSAAAYLAASGVAAPTPAPVIHTPALLLSKNTDLLACVGVPIYNEEPYIEQTVRSLLNQTADRVGFLIADNCSTDRTLEIVRDIVGADTRFQIFQHERNQGSAANFRFVFENSSSNYFMWLGGHDYLSPRYFEEVMHALDSDPGLSMVLGIPQAVQGAAIRALESAIYDFSDPSPENRYLDSVGRLANCTIVQSLFRKMDLQDIEIRALPSFDHVLLSHLLWKGRLAYAQNATYYRRYFPARADAANARISGSNANLSIADFYQYYLNDFTKLAQSTIDPIRLQALVATMRSTLIQRFGQLVQAPLV